MTDVHDEEEQCGNSDRQQPSFTTRKVAVGASILGASLLFIAAAVSFSEVHSGEPTEVQPAILPSNHSFADDLIPILLSDEDFDSSLFLEEPSQHDGRDLAEWKTWRFQRVVVGNRIYGRKGHIQDLISYCNRNSGTYSVCHPVAEYYAEKGIVAKYFNRKGIKTKKCKKDDRTFGHRKHTWYPGTQNGRFDLVENSCFRTNWCQGDCYATCDLYFKCKHP